MTNATRPRSTARTAAGPEGIREPPTAGRDVSRRASDADAEAQGARGSHSAAPAGRSDAAHRHHPRRRLPGRRVVRPRRSGKRAGRARAVGSRDRQHSHPRRRRARRAARDRRVPLADQGHAHRAGRGAAGAPQHPARQPWQDRAARHALALAAVARRADRHARPGLRRVAGAGAGDVRQHRRRQEARSR